MCAQERDDHDSNDSNENDRPYHHGAFDTYRSGSWIVFGPVSSAK